MKEEDRILETSAKYDEVVEMGKKLDAAAIKGSVTRADTSIATTSDWTTYRSVPVPYTYTSSGGISVSPITSDDWISSIQSVTIQKRVIGDEVKWVVLHEGGDASRPYDTFIEAAIEMARILDPDTYEEIKYGNINPVGL